MKEQEWPTSTDVVRMLEYLQRNPQHPFFEDTDDEAVEQRRWTPERQRAEDWLRDLAARAGETCVNYSELWDEFSRGPRTLERGKEYQGRKRWEPITYEMLLQAGHDWLDHEDYLVQFGAEGLRDLMYEGDNRELFWKHWETITERKVTEEQRQEAPFTCSC